MLIEEESYHVKTIINTQLIFEKEKGEKEKQRLKWQFERGQSVLNDNSIISIVFGTLYIRQSFERSLN